MPQNLNERYADRVTEANARVMQANTELVAARTALASAEAAAAANPQDPILTAAVARAKEGVKRAEDILKFEHLLLDRLLHPGKLQSVLESVNWAAVLQYTIFASLALFVLWHLMSGLTKSPPAGSTPRSMITFLIAVVTVGIALILVLATIVSDSPDREKRFLQGKEVLTALIGILGTIVGFYFGIAQDPAKRLDFEPVFIKEVGDQVTLQTAVKGGKAPYFYEITFTPNSIKAVKEKSSDGQIKAVFAVAGKQETEVSFVISVRDSDGNTGNVDYQKALRLRVPVNADGQKKE